MSDRIHKAHALETAVNLLVKQAVGYESSAKYHDERAAVAPETEGAFHLSKPWHERQAKNLRDEAAWIHSEAHVLVAILEELK